jgi:hypothetical protein
MPFPNCRFVIFATEPAKWRCSGGGWRVEPVDEFDEHVLEAGVVVVGVLPDERDHLPIAVGGLSVLATGLVHHAEAVVAVVDLGEPHLEVAGGLLGLVELAGADQVGSGVGRNGQFVLFGVPGAGENRRDGGFHLTKRQTMGGGAFDAPSFGVGKLLALSRFLLGKATLLVLGATLRRRSNPAVSSSSYLDADGKVTASCLG